MMIQRPLLVLSLLASVPPGAAHARTDEEVRNVSGGELRAQQAAFDVLHYDLDLRVAPRERTIRGTLGMRARLMASTDFILLHLDGALEATRVTSGGVELPFVHSAGELRIGEPSTFEAIGEGGVFTIEVEYGGTPRVAPHPPWKGGFTWKETADGSPWIATSCQGEGADLWWPCKDHPSDEPDSMDLAITVPLPLVVASNGRPLGVEDAEPGWRTFLWRVSTPINNYGVALNIAPYETITRDYESTAGDVFPVTYWVLPENLEQGKVLFEEMLEHLRFYEETFGPYPFRADKYGVAETPHLGMEHQTIIAYGNRYRGNIWGPKRWKFDSLHHHELGHEWWGNLVTARSWEDMWIHEGFCTYAQALYVERLHGREAYHRQMDYYRKGHGNHGPVAPRRTLDTHEVYFGGEGRDAPGGDVYNKGACVLHTLRWTLGDEPFFRVLRRMSYPEPSMENKKDGSACRFTSTDEFLAIAEKHAERELDWFFEVYLRQPALPVLESEVVADELRLSWKAPAGLAFPMPIEVRLGDELVRVDMEGGVGSVALGGESYELDPNDWILEAER